MPVTVAACGEMALAATVFFVPSVCSFLAYQAKEAHWKQAPVSDSAASLASFRLRPFYESLTLDLLRSLNPRRCMRVISDFVQELNGSELAQASPGQQMVRAVIEVDSEVQNGGFHQYYWNTQGRRAFMAVEGYALLKQEEHRQLMLETIDVFLHEESQQDEHRPDDVSDLVEKYHEARSESVMPQFDSRYYKLSGIYEEIENYIQSHLSEFVGRLSGKRS